MKFLNRVAAAVGEIFNGVPTIGDVLTGISVMMFAALAVVFLIVFSTEYFPGGAVALGILLIAFILYGPVMVLLRVYRDWNS